MQSELLLLSALSVDSSIHAVNHGAICICRKGTAEVSVNFDRWKLEEDSVIVFFPGDVIRWRNTSGDFQASAIRYSSEILRTACMNMEHSVYSRLRADRICTKKEVVESVVKSMFRTLDFYFADTLAHDTDNIVISQLRSFFTGYNDYVTHLNDESALLEASRTDTLFNQFMELVQTEYHKAHEVAWFAAQLNISRKYLGIIVKNKTGVTPKKIIDECIILQLQLALRTSQKPLKLIASEFHFADASVLTRYFKAHTGMNPLKYRNS